MITVNADAAMVEKLLKADGLAEVRDPGGNVVGFFAPVSLNHAPQYARAAASIDREELARRKASRPTGRTTREVFERLKGLTDDPELRAHLQEKIDGLSE